MDRIDKLQAIADAHDDHRHLKPPDPNRGDREKTAAEIMADVARERPIAPKAYENDALRLGRLGREICLGIDMAFDPAQKGIGGAPTRATTFPHGSLARKQHPVASGVLDYFPDALVGVALVSQKGNDQHNPGQPLHWDRAKSGDEADAMMRHFLQRGTNDEDGIPHSAKMVWRALAFYQKEIEDARRSPKRYG